MYADATSIRAGIAGRILPLIPTVAGGLRVAGVAAPGKAFDAEWTGYQRLLNRALLVPCLSSDRCRDVGNDSLVVD